MNYTNRIGLLVAAYKALAPTTHKWPGRLSSEGQALLSGLRDQIAVSLRLSEEYVQSCGESPSTPSNPLLSLELYNWYKADQVPDSPEYREFMRTTVPHILAGLLASAGDNHSENVMRTQENCAIASANAIWNQFGGE